MSRHMTPWESLGVPEDATREQIDAAYRKLATRYHPDKAMRSDNPLLADWRDPYPVLVWRWIEAAYKLLTDEAALAAYQYRRHHKPAEPQPTVAEPRSPVPQDHAPPAPSAWDAVVQPVVEDVQRKTGEVFMEAGRAVLEGTFEWLTGGKKKRRPDG